VHLAAAIRDQPGGSIEELGGIATWRMVEAAERAGVEHFVFFSALGATGHDRTRFLRTKALAEDAVAGGAMPTTTFAPSIVYAPGDVWMTMLERLSLLPLVPLPGRGRALYQPIWAQDVADCVMAALERGPGVGGERHERFELAGPETLSHEAIVRLALESFGRPRPLVKVPAGAVRQVLRLGEAVFGGRVPVTWDEAELLEVSLTTPRGTRDAERLGVTPQAMARVLGVA